MAAQRRLETCRIGLGDFGDDLEDAFARLVAAVAAQAIEEPVGDAGDIFGALEIGRPPAHAAHRVLHKSEQERALVVRKGREIAMNEPQDRWPRGAVWHVEDRSLPDQAGEPVGRLHAGHTQQMNDPFEKGAAVGEQLRLVAR